MGTVQKRRGAGAVGRTSWCGGVTSVVRGSTPLVHRGSGGAHHPGTKEVSRLGSQTADLAPELEGPLSDCCMPAAFRWTQCSLLLLVGHVAAPFGLRPSSEYGADPAVVAASIRAATEAMRRGDFPAHGIGVPLHLGEDADRAQKRQRTDEEDEEDEEDGED